MYPISNETKNIFMNSEKQYIDISFNGVSDTIHITEKDVIQGGLSINRFSTTGNKIEIGSVTAGELTLTLNNTDGRYNDVTFEGAELFVKVGVKAENGNIQYISLGYFTVDEAPRKLSRISLTSLDRMVMFDKTADKNEFVLPMPVNEFVEKICNLCSVSLATTNFSGFANSAYVINTFPEDDRITYRQLLSWAAEILGVCGFIDWDGKLALKWYSATDTKFDTHNRFTSDLQENSISITGICVSDGDTDYMAGTDDYAIKIEGNRLIQHDEQIVANALYQKLGGFTYTPFTTTVFPMPHIYPLDMAIFEDKNEISYNVIITDVTFTVGKNTQVEGKGETVAKNGYAVLNPLTQREQAIIENLKKNVDNKISEREQAVIGLNETICNALGLHKTETEDAGGGKTYYFHDGDTLANSNIIYVHNAGGFAWTDDWNNGNPVWQYGVSKDGNAVLNMLSVYKIQSDFLEAGCVTSDKLSTGCVDTDKLSAGCVSADKLSIGYKNSVSDAIDNAIYASLMATGKMLYTDPTFKKGLNSLLPYNNAANGNVTINRSENSAAINAPTDYVMEIKNIGAADPPLGGFRWGHLSRANAVFIYKIIAKLPEGAVIEFATNAVGDGYIRKWIKRPIGDNTNYKEYIFYLKCGSSGTFSSTGFFHLTGVPHGTVSNPVIWYVSYATVYDCTEQDNPSRAIAEWCYDNDVTYIDGGKIYAKSITANQIDVDTIFANKIESKTDKNVYIDLASGEIAASKVAKVVTLDDGTIKKFVLDIDALGISYYYDDYKLFSIEEYTNVANKIPAMNLGDIGKTGEPYVSFFAEPHAWTVQGTAVIDTSTGEEVNTPYYMRLEAGSKLYVGNNTDTYIAPTEFNFNAGTNLTLKGDASTGIICKYGSNTIFSINSTGFHGNIDGTATAANKLSTAQTINGVEFDGTSNITVYDPHNKPGVSKNVNSVGWYRIAEVNYTTCGSFSLSLNRFYNNLNSESHTFSINIAHQTAKIIEIGRDVNYSSIGKIRVLAKPSNKFYVEIYYSTSTNNSCYAHFLNISDCTVIPINFTSVDTIPDGYTNITELDISTPNILTMSAGSSTQPVYISNGRAVACTYTLGKSVPADAKFTDTTYSSATTSSEGLMSVSDKIKLNGIAENANNYTHPNVSHIPSGGERGQVLGWLSSGVAKWTHIASAQVGTVIYTGQLKGGEGITLDTNGYSRLRIYSRQAYVNQITEMLITSDVLNSQMNGYAGSFAQPDEANKYVLLMGTFSIPSTKMRFMPSFWYYNFNPSDSNSGLQLRNNTDGYYVYKIEAYE